MVLSAGMGFKIGGFREGKGRWSGSSNEKQGHLLDNLLDHRYEKNCRNNAIATISVVIYPTSLIPCQAHCPLLFLNHKHASAALGSLPLPFPQPGPLFSRTDTRLTPAPSPCLCLNVTSYQCLPQPLSNSKCSIPDLWSALLRSSAQLFF